MQARTFPKRLAKLALCAGLAASFGAMSAQAEEYYAGKTVTLLVGFSPGGGTDQFARVVADHLDDHIPGNPSVIVQNMPGSGSVLASNHYVTRVEPDGETLMVGTGQLLMRILLGLRGSQAELTQYDPLMAGPAGRVTFASPELGIETPQDIQAKATEMIHASAGIMASIDTLLGLKVLDTEIRAITGYKGKSETLLAFERGEANVDGQTMPNYTGKVQPMVEEGNAVPLFSQGFIDEAGRLVADPAVPDLPTVADVYRTLNDGQDPAGPAWDAYMAMTGATVSLGRVLMVHEEAPDDAVAALEAGIASMLKDATFQKEIEASLNGYVPYDGPALEAAVNAVRAMSPETKTWLKEFLTRAYGARFE